MLLKKKSSKEPQILFRLIANMKIHCRSEAF